ncbi:polysaccharide deacetylase family protein [Paenibacillus sinopodophylli]|uniref:polysaccharide deacetylase family protein n=1 Tax=Paenibacillus sinopodophylli TaxID=1837342 RepID=UPI00110CE2E3|nr:polysaccharide deacetylase family protein [Paenibacillus sinopodophylli]
MKNRHLIIYLVLIGTLLTSCSANHTDKSVTVSNEVSSTEMVTPAAVIPSATDAQLSSPANTEPIPTPTLTTTEEGKQPEARYEMNAAYRLVPISTNATDKVVLLTFDDGPKDSVVLTSLLDTLDKHDAKAIFFVNGYRVKQNPDLLKLIDKRGQTIGNHSWDHINLKNEAADIVDKQINDVQTAVEALIGKKPTFFRPPYGSGGDDVKKIAKNHGMLYMTWSNGSLDWDKSAKDKPEVVINNVMEQLHPGANILMHELKWTAEALDKLLTNLETKGYGFIDPSSIAISP